MIQSKQSDFKTNKTEFYTNLNITCLTLADKDITKVKHLQEQAENTSKPVTF